MIYGLDLFSGIGGLTIALSEWVRPLAYCEIDPYARGVLLSRMYDRMLPRAPIWDDIRTLRGREFAHIDLIYGGFPCQDISCAGTGKGLEGERSGLFFQILRIVSEVRPPWIFLENVPAITTRGLGTVTAEITKAGYDCRWTTLSAAEVGANHKRERWWLLAYSNDSGFQIERTEQQPARALELCEVEVSNADRNGIRDEPRRELWESGESEAEFVNDSPTIPYSSSEGLEGQREESSRTQKEYCNIGNESWWAVEPKVGRVAHGIPSRVDRIKGLGNAVVPLQAREAFKELMGLK